MTFDEYINNPMGVKSAVISNREMYRKMYIEKLDKILMREVGKIEYKLYHSDKKYFCYMKIPSEVIDKFYYDVVIEFSPPKDNKIGDATLNKYDVRFFSNDPSFVFTFCYTFKKNGMFITEYKDKMSQRALTEKPVEKNPTMTVGYVKSLYFAYLVMKRRGLFTKIKYIDMYSKKNILKQIEDTDTKIEERQLAGERKAKRKKAIQKAKEQARQASVDKYVSKFVKKTNTINSIGSVNNKVKTTKTVKRK